MKLEVIELTEENAAQSGNPLPMLNAKVWSLCFLLIGIVLTIVMGLTMPDFFAQAYGK
ncbi:MAG: hypothetical protein K6T63_06560 [Alicyclobacillus herbarius]|uniref:hypothetical protein n=1 Tax=Alicyclobacillus herbarius TaxID=122960 RepID=UPI0004165574|nr:hypothetical protein [Alicyclobacillus herbarius]MCL6632283.1 hypothetical protein [Alicyclobacillus herbarius]